MLMRGSKMVNTEMEENLENDEGWLSRWFKWSPTSLAALKAAEEKIFSHLKTSYEAKFVPISNNNRIWTVYFNPSTSRLIPLVLIHGFGGGIGLWAQNFDALGKNRPVYAFDLIGFGRSSRPSFQQDAMQAEMQFVDSIEDWREEMKLDSFILLGHSLGGFLAASYALKYPTKVKKLILVDPWGFPERPPDSDHPANLPLWLRFMGYILKPFNPLAALRASGPFGPKLVERFRPDLKVKFSDLGDNDIISQYIYHCNAQTPSGETAFRNMTIPFGWAKYPMIQRIRNLVEDIPVTMIYGSRSWIDSSTGTQVKVIQPNSCVDVQIVRGAGHHVYADKSHEFNNLVLKACDVIDNENENDDMPLKE